MTVRFIKVVLVLAFLLFVSRSAFAFDIQVLDTPNDDGTSLLVVWKVQPFEDGSGSYVVEVSASESGEFVKVLSVHEESARKSDYPQYFGWDKDNKNWHAVKITQAPAPRWWYLQKEEERKQRVEILKKQLRAFEHKLKKERSKRLRKKLEARISLINKEIKRLSEPRKKNALAPIVEGATYWVRVRHIAKDGTEQLSSVVSGVATGEWFHTGKLNLLLVMLLLSALVMYYIQKARRHPEKIYLRKIPGLEAIDDAIGRATEMGKPIFFVHGLASMASISTIAAINILGKIAEKVAEYGTEFKVTNRDPVVFAVSQETVKEAYLRAGRPDLYKEENVFYVSQDQFSYASAIEGMFLREKPASNFFFGYYFAEALLLTETGAVIGAIQIAGTDAYTQLPFFITTCDYTLMGEELYAASAYLSREPKLLGSVKAQDVGKTLMIFTILIGVILSSLGFESVVHFFEVF